MTRLVWILPAALVLFSGCDCIPNINLTDGGFFDVTPQGTGGIVIDTSTGVAVNVPQGAVDNETIINITLVDTGIPDVPGRKRISYGYRLSPSMLQLNSPITLYLPYLDERVPMGVDPGTFDMRRQTTMDPYLALPGSATLAALKSVQAQTDHLGLFWLTSPAQADVAMLTIDPTEVFLKVGDTKQFTASVTDSTGATVDAALKWKTLPPRVGTLTTGNDGGFFTALDPGIATVSVTAGLQTAVATVHVQGTAVGPSTYVHENPFPTGNDLWGGLVLPGTLGSLFVGANGTVLSRDMSAMWTRLYSSPGLTLKAVGATTQTNAVAVGSLGTAGVLVEMQGTGAPKVTTYTTVDPHFMWYDGTNGMAVGTGNDVLVKRNGAWTKEYNPSFEPLLSVLGDGLGGFVVLGGQGSLYKYDPATMRWNSLYQTQLAVLLTAGALVDAAGTEAWACGGNKLWHFQANAWTSLNLPPQPVLTEVDALGLVDSKIVIGGVQNRTGYAEVFDPSMLNVADAGTDADGGALTPGWTVIPLRGPQIARGFFSAGPTSMEGYLVGDYGMVWRYSAGTLVEESRGFYGDVVSVATLVNDVIAGVNECANPPGCTALSGAVYHRTGPSQFEKLGGDVQPFTGAVFSVVANSATDVVVSTQSGVFYYDGSSWQLSQTSASSPLTALKYCGTTTLYGVDATGTWYRGGPTVMARQPAITSSGLYAFNCPTDMQEWTAGDGVLYERNGSASWVQHSSMNVTQAGWRSVWSPGQGEAFAFGQAAFGIYWNTEDLVLIDSPGGVQPTAINGLWGSSVDNLYAVGVVTLPFSFGMGVRFDGSDWKLVDVGSQREVMAIDGASPLNVWLGSRGGGILRGVGP